MNAIEQSPEQSPAPNALAHLTRVPIAQLSPDLEQLAAKSFLAAIALVWPYSSSTKSVSLLLVEPDFRLRGAKGQIKVTFHGHVAEKVAETHVGIGDTVCLALEHTKFISNEGAQQTPGRSVAWDAHFENGASLEIYRSAQPPLVISVEPQAAAPRETEPAPPTTPSGKSINSELDLPYSARAWGSPAFLKSTRVSSGGTIRSAFDPFAEEDGFVPGKGRKKPRYSLHREDWRIIHEPESPHEQEAPVDWEQALDQSIDQELDTADSANEPLDEPMTDAVQVPEHTEDAPQEPLAVFAKPSLELTGSILERNAGESNVMSEQGDTHEKLSHLPTDTPQIRPIPSPGLPVPSPIVSNPPGSAGYFLPSTAPPQPQEVRSVPGETDTVATPAPSPIETHGIEAVDSIHTETVEIADPDVDAIQQEHVLDAGFVFGDDLASGPGSDGLPEEQEVEKTIDSKVIEESDVAEVDVVMNTAGDEARTSNEAEQKHALDDLNLPRDHPASLTGSEGESDLESVAAQAATGTENAVVDDQTSTKTDDERLIDVSYLWRDDSASSSRSREGLEDGSLESSEGIDGSDIVQAELGIETASGNVESSQYSAGFHGEEHAGPETQPVNYPQPPSAFDQDAIDALEKMIAAREEENERKEDMEEEKEIEDDIERSPSQGYSEENDEMVKDQEVYYAESVENYDSQCEYEEDEEDFHSDPRLESRLDQDDFSDVESSDEKSEQNLPSQTASHDVIVLDSDSDDEAASNDSVAPASQSAERGDHSDRFEYGHPTVPPATADFATGVQEYPEPWSVDREDDYHEAVEEDPDIDERQESEESEESEDGDEREYNQQDDRVHESDMDDDESSRDYDGTDHPSEVASPNPEEDENKEVQDVELIEEADNDEYHAAAELDTQIEVPIGRDSDEEQSGNADPNLLDMPGSHQGPSSAVESHAERYLTGDGQSDLHIPSSAVNIVADFLLSHGPTVEGPEPLGGRVSPTRPPLEQQLLTPDPTQENTATRELVHHFEPEASFTVEKNEAPTGLDKTLQPAGSPESDQEEGIGAEPIKNIQQQIHVGGNDDAMAPLSLTEAAERPTTPAPGRSVEVVISTESPKAPAAPVSQSPVRVAEPSVPDRNASGLRSKLSYFAPLATLIDHYNALVDTISIVQEASPITRAKSGSKDWFMTIQLTDPSMAGTTLRAQIFRRYKASMPSLAEGNAILLRDFKVRSLDHTVMLVSVDSSAWAVFDGSGPDAETSGPPVEYDSQERAYASGLRRWYDEVGSDRVADHMLQAAIERDGQERDTTPSSQVPSESGSPDSRRGSQRKRKSNRRVTIHELRDGTRYTEVGSPNSRSSSVHELRDGTLYANI
ncbi:hypothetical protein PENNAL_c0037G07156 [Penicillium nalgiovense]|uniref:Telomeric single stranded DNA binding POT1/Cdc13 domain-containing protein n=1 Tax=Penicillium nalgiovense TaxID=60175 RepID=A0A1V6Y4D4_PENNA|nr:hypothetical protein PENNAL_c0037G07156 [Penicillium nalgiovense]